MASRDFSCSNKFNIADNGVFVIQTSCHLVFQVVRFPAKIWARNNLGIIVVFDV